MNRRTAISAVWLAVAATTLLAAGCELSTGPPRYTILLAVLDHPDYHVQDAKYWKESAQDQTGWRDLYVIHENSLSKLYRGKYSSLSKAQACLAEARRFRTKPSDEAPDGVMVFALGKIVPALGIDMGPPEWMLANNTPDVRYTLVVAEFFSQPGYREPEKYAVEYCTQLRDEGYEAFLYHTPAKSYVTIGNFPESSYQMVTSRQSSREFAHRGWALPDIPDPKLKQLVREFPELAINGRRNIIHHVNPMTGEKEEFADPSRIMDIPHSRGAYGD